MVFPTTATATGTLTLTVSSLGTGAMATLSGTIALGNIGTITAVHLHNAHAALNGGYLSAGAGPFMAAPLTMTSATVSGTVTLTAADLAELTAGRVYVDIQSANFPASAVRGQVLPPGSQLYSAQLLATNEVPPLPGVPSTGGVSFIQSSGTTALVFEGDWTNDFAAAGSQIELAPAGSTGTTVFTLSFGAAVHISGTIPPATLGAGSLNNAGYDVNVTSSKRPLGVIRGQIIKH